MPEQTTEHGKRADGPKVALKSMVRSGKELIDALKKYLRRE